MTIKLTLRSPLSPETVLSRISEATEKINYRPMGHQKEWPGAVNGNHFVFGYAGELARKQNCFFCGAVQPDGTGSCVTGMFRTPLRLYIVLVICFVAAGVYLGLGESPATALSFAAAALGASVLLYVIDGLITQQIINSAARKVLLSHLREIMEAPSESGAQENSAEESGK
ncbi:MAG TPA: hypothetical protein PK597_05350 [Oscillospiraceae bacterium]|nr:hypothetical protein [Oscillospiraceae bacterium]